MKEVKSNRHPLAASFWTPCHAAPVQGPQEPTILGPSVRCLWVRTSPAKVTHLSAESMTSPSQLPASGHLYELLRAPIPSKDHAVSATDTKIPSCWLLDHLRIHRVKSPKPESHCLICDNGAATSHCHRLQDLCSNLQRGTQHQPESHYLSLRL